MDKVKILGVAFDNLTTDQFHQIFAKRIAEHEPTFVVTGNPEIVMAAQENPEYLKIIQQDADYITPDGTGIILASRWQGHPLPERVTGYDLFLWLLKLADQQHLRVYLLGSMPHVVHEAGRRIRRDYPHAELLAAEDGYFKDNQFEVVVNRIHKAQPDLVFIGTGAPKQERLIKALKEAGTGALMMGVGGTFDVFSGEKKRAPRWMQQAHIEWLYRLVTEPTRIGRMMVLPQFARAAYQEAKRKKKEERA
ncbi:WecB/TagA/CpsF family glycosyltransferase [Lactobacillus corticis]|uniref:N-acetylglucosaminyldiphosphoundecaprenol N-acetyl-beta-D-mannosaminyltransferase n=1 Tax=Lactobacillus corticis TaxID=2201249 RepID=A0A916QHH8_9LACO|nr:WecB/TagA/CpsF family glycosyltransferase [Lactobacillus corticis]GFZ26348.1 WecB/TagA/CpsF family glycosyl transferase [Lactobacillus corticis]